MDPDDRGYHAQHTWARAEGDGVRIGIINHAQAELDTVVYVDLPAPGAHVRAGEPFGEIASNKAISDLVAPLSGAVAARNDAVAGDPDLVNRDPYGAGWLIVVTPDDPGQLDELLIAEQYGEQVAAR